MDAVRDLDDALTLTHLFATLPAESRYDIPGQVVERCRRLVMEWQAYCARGAALRKVFISVKGFYYQVGGGWGSWGEKVARMGRVVFASGQVAL